MRRIFVGVVGPLPGDVQAHQGLEQATGLKQSHLYTGEYWDQDAQLLYLRARWYDPRIGRFISADPFEGRQRDPRTLNRYAYASNDPVSLIDPTGKFSSIGEVSAAQAIGGIVTTAAAVSMLGTVNSLHRSLSLSMAASSVGTFYAIDPKVRSDLETCIESSRSGENKCRSQYALFIVGDDTPTVRDHVGDAKTNGSPGTLSKGPSHGRWYAPRYVGAGKPCSGAAGTECDEYPFNATNEGGPAHYPATVSLRSVVDSDNSRAGGYLGQFYRKCGAAQAASYKVVAARGISRGGYVCAR